jgi:hypothetical protein
VVIPLVDEKRVFSNIRKFPWQAFFRSTGILAALAIACAYALRYGREAVLYFGSRKGGRTGARFLYLLLLARLASDGKPIKPASKTASEYSQLFGSKGESPHFMNLASLYSQLRWREFADNAERDKCFTLLEQEYKNILAATRQKGIHKQLLRILSLRGLAYL